MRSPFFDPHIILMLAGEAYCKGVDTSALCEQIENEDIIVFVFETLMNQELRQKLLHADVQFEIDSIPNYKEITTDTEQGTNYHTIIPMPGCEVKGHALHCNPEQLAIFDDWEDQYKRERVLLKSGRLAYVYVLKPEFMKDYGKNTSYDLSQDDIDIIARDMK